MPDLSSIAASALSSYFEEIQRKTHEWTAPISTPQLWVRPYPYGNSIGHLLLHITGNLNYYVGAQIGGSAYVRHREVEFNDTQKRPKEQVLGDFDSAISMVVKTIREQSPEDWGKPYSAEREAIAKDRFTMFLRCAGHAQHHLGQIIYLCKELTKSPV